MNLLPSEQEKAVEEAIKKYDETGKLNIFEPCNCGSHIRHNNGGNYHDEIYLWRDKEQHFVMYGSTCELDAPNEWEPCEDPHAVIQENADWL